LLYIPTLSVNAMPELRQSHTPGHPLHVIQRGWLRAACFFHDHDRIAYLNCLAQDSRRLGCALHAYALMGNHVHLLLTPERAHSVTRLMHCLAEHHERYTRKTPGRDDTLQDGHASPLWEKSFETIRVHVRQYLLACMRYIELNPVRAGLVSRPQAYRWSSFRANALGAEDALLTPHAHYCTLGRSPEIRQAAYRTMFKQQVARAGKHFS
jgi:putative transposase